VVRSEIIWGVSSIKPNHAGREIHGGEEVSRGLVVTSGDRAVLLEFGEEVPDQMTSAVEMSIGASSSASDWPLTGSPPSYPRRSSITPSRLELNAANRCTPGDVAVALPRNRLPSIAM
jgi:hypothetical protein